MNETDLMQVFLTALGNSPVAVVLVWAVWQFIKLIQMVLARQETDVTRLESAQNATGAKVEQVHQDVLALPERIAARLNTHTRGAGQ